QTAGDLTKVQTVLDRAGLPPAEQTAIRLFCSQRLRPLLCAPTVDREAARFGNSRFFSQFSRAFVLSLFVFLWFFIVPVPGLFTFIAKGYRFATGLGSIVTIVAWGVGLAFITLWIGQFVQWIDYRRLNHIGLKQRSENTYRNFQSLLGKGRELTSQE